MSQDSTAATSSTQTPSRYPAFVPVLILLVAAAICATVLSPGVWLVALTDGLYVVAVVAAAAGWGIWPAVWLGFGRRPRGQQFCIATALGLGVLSTVVLMLGVGGLLGRAVAWVLVATGALLGMARLYAVQRSTRSAGEPHDAGCSPAREVVLRSLALLPLCIPLAVALVGASLPPGLLWRAEARGYDALEYHLQVPREYFEAGRITFLRHNVYASFPQQMESLYLLLMYLVGDPWRAAIPAQWLHAVLGALAVVALAAWARPGWPRVLVALIAGAVPWLAYLGCLAYVELGVVFFAAVAAGLVAERCRGGPDPNWRAGLTAGLCVGFAAGCKYTAMALIIVPLGLARLAAWRPGLRMRLRQLALFAIGAGAAICPWLIRNWAFTGNPVYPFAYRWLDGAAWSPEQDAQWARGHRLPADQASLADRATILSDELFRSHLFGPAIWLVPAAAVVLRPTRRSLFAVLWIVLLIGAWTALTRMPGRFAVPVVVPLALLVSGARGGRSPSAACPRAAGRVDWRLAALVVAAWAGAVFGGVSLLGLLRAEEQHYQACGVNLPELVGTPEVMIQSNPINQAVRDPDAYVWLVGDAASFYVAPHRHYTVAFSRDPWLEFAAGPVTPADCVAWLRTRHVTHVVFSWPEIERLRRTYGFTPLVTPAWVQELERAGLRRVAPAAGNESLAIYEVPTQ